MRARISSTRTDHRLPHPGTGPLGPKGREALRTFLALAGAALLAAGLAALVILMNGCAAQKPPVAVVAPCPRIPLPSRPEAPSVVLPAQDAQGRYCLTQEQVNGLAKGIRDLQGYAAKIEAAVTLYNEERIGKR